jgi:FAD-dependent urate hydroxylase
MQKFVLFLTSLCVTLTGYSDITPVEDYQDRLDLLQSQVEKELTLLDYPRRPWTIIKKRADGELIYDAVIIGGGQTGLALAFALRKEKINNVILFDENDEGLEGPWLTYGRMPNLRSPKHVIGPDCNVPSLTCQSWCEAKYGAETWASFANVPRKMWAEYLRWFRQTLKLPVVNNTKVGAISWDAENKCFILPVNTKGEEKTVYSRKIILATGFQGSGEWTVPDTVKNNLPPHLYTSVYKNVDFENLRGKKVAVLGAGPCAFDAVTMCHQHGAEEIHLFIRREKLPNLHAFRWGEYSGFLNHFPDLDDETKWRYVAKIFEMGQPPTPDGFAYVRSLPNVVMHFSSPWVHTEQNGEKAVVHTPTGVFEFDHLLTATGWNANLKLRPELKNIEDKIALWSDRFAPPEHQNYDYLLTMPYLGKHFEFIEKNPGEAPYLNSIFNCTGAALLSEGLNAGTGLIGMKFSTQKIVYGLVGQIFLEDKDYHFQSLENYNDILFPN